MSMLVAAAALFLVQDGAALPTDRDTLSEYFQHACRIQQVDQNGGTTQPDDHAGFCNCFEIEAAADASDDMFRIYALGSQGALQERSMIPEWEAARDETIRMYEALPPEEQTRLQSNMQDALYACLGE